MNEYTLCLVNGKPCSGRQGSCITCGKSVKGKKHYSIDGEETLCNKCYAFWCARN